MSLLHRKPCRRRLLTLSLLLFALLPVDAQEAPSVVPPTPPISQSAADVVFADEAYQRGLDTTHTTIEDVFKLASHLIAEAWGGLMDWLEALFLASPLLGWLVFVAMLIVLALLLWHIGWTFTRAFSRPSAQDGDDGGVSDDRRRRCRDLREDARRLAQAGDRREGIRSLLLALLALLAEERLLSVARSWTPRETLARVGARIGEVRRSELLSFQTVVEEALYGAADVSASDFADCDAVLDRLVRSLRDLPRSDR